MQRPPIRILITTSRRPTRRIRSLVKDLVAILPGAERITRGHLSLDELASEAYLRGADRVLIIYGKKGNPSLIKIYKTTPNGLEAVTSLIIKGLSLSREIRRPLPDKKPTGIVVTVDGSSIADLVADSIVIGLKARVFEEARGDDLKIILRSISDNTVLAEFSFMNKLVGPRLKLSLPRKVLGI